MKNNKLSCRFLKIVSAIVCAMLLSLSFVACTDGKGDSSSSGGTKEEENYADVVIFMGQSNMAGRGEAKDSVICEQGHGYEFRAVADPTKLYDLEEPFGATENNDALADLNSVTQDGKKSGDMVAAFCEGYYEQTGRPVVGVSASVGGTSVKLWVPGTSYYEESRRRLTACIDFLVEDGTFKVGNVFMVWCQGESDTTNWKNGKGNYDYFGQLKSIVTGLKTLDNGYGIQKCLIVTPSEYTNGELHEVKNDLVNHIIEWTLADDDFLLASKKFRNVPLNMRADPHFHQGIYNVTGYDAAVNTAYYLKTGKQPDCKEFILGEDVTLAEKFGISPEYTSM